MKNILLIFAFLMVFSIGETIGQSYKVIVNNSNMVTSISKKDVSNMFLKKKSKWGNGNAIIPVDQKIGSSTRESFTTEIHNKKVASIRSYWQQAIFSGVATAPVEKDSDSEVIEYVKSTPGAIGYISSTTNAQGVKVVSISN